MRATKATSLMTAAILSTVCAFAEQGMNNSSSSSSLQSSVIGSAPSTTVGGVSSAGAKWAVSQSNVSIQPNGQAGWDIQVQLQNLLLASGTGIGTTGSVRAVAASVVCGGSGGQVVASTPAATLDRTGAAQIQATVALPGGCSSPVVLVRVATASAPLGPFIASTGLAAIPGNDSPVSEGNDLGDH